MDLSNISTEELLKMRGQPKTDLSSVSTEELLGMYKQEQPAEAREPLTPLTEEQKAQTQRVVEEVAPTTTIGQEALKIENIAPALREGARSATRTALDTVSFGIAGGYADEIEAGIRSTFDDREFGEIRDEINRQYDAQPTSAKLADFGLRVYGALKGGGIMGETLVGSNLLGKMSGTAGRSLAGGVSAFGESEGDLLATGTGAVFGAASPLIAKPFVKGAEKVEQFSKLAKNLLNKISSKSSPQSLNKLASTDAGQDILVSGANASRSFADKIRPRVDKSIRGTNNRVNKAVLKELGVNDPSDLMIQSKKEFGEWSNWAKDKFIPQNKVKNLMGSRIVKNEAKKMVANNPQKWGSVKQNNVGFLQELKSKILAKSRKGGVDSEDFRDAGNLITDFIDTNSTGYKTMNQRYASSLGKEQLAKSMIKGKARIGSNVASLLDKPDTYKELSDEFGEDVAKRIQGVIIREQKLSEGLKKIKAATSKGQKSLSEKFKDPKTLALLGFGSYGIANPVVGGLGLGAIKGADLASASRAGGELLGTRQIDPFVQAVLSGQMGKLGASPLVQTIGEIGAGLGIGKLRGE